MNTIKSIELFYQEGSSDKVYNAAIVEEDDGSYTVQVEWGRRGSSLNRGTKAVKVTLEKAEQAYERVVRQKTGKGYEELTDEVQPAAVAPPEGEGSGSKASRRPGSRARLGQAAQLLNPVDGDAVGALLSDPGIVAQQKLDGVRLLSHVGEEGVVVTNRQGQVTSAPPAVIAALGEIDANTILDGELVGGDYHLFDILTDAGHDLRDEGYLDRLDCLEELADSLGPPLHLVQTAHTPEQKRALFARLQREGAEGIVFKRADAPYRPGRPASGGKQLKHKFVKSADVVMLENAGNAYLMGVHDDEGRLRPVGKVFAGTTNDTRRQLDEALAAGEHPVAEVRYLYATDDSQLYQPVFCQLRHDKEPEDCLLSQLEYTSREVVELTPTEPQRRRGPADGDWTLEVLAILGAICRR
jgi:bifunctional non-homologous end joining protein LigD